MANGELVDQETQTWSGPRFFAVSNFKFALLAICSFGFYVFFWFYQNWTLIKARTRQDILPFWRTFFSVIWAYSCFKEINKAGAPIFRRDGINSGWLALAYVLLMLSVNLPDPYWTVSLLNFVPLLVVNQYTIKINEAGNPEYDRNSHFSWQNWLLIIFGGLFFLMAIFGAFLPPEPIS
jgi:hypothetical protein